MVHPRSVPSPPERVSWSGPRDDDPAAGQGAFSSAYWLSHCEGFRVDTSQGKLGIVEEVVLDTEGRPQALLVLGGAVRQRRWRVPVDDIAVVQPGRERVALVDPVPAAISVEPRP